MDDRDKPVSMAQLNSVLADCFENMRQLTMSYGVQVASKKLSECYRREAAALAKPEKPEEPDVPWGPGDGVSANADGTTHRVLSVHKTRLVLAGAGGGPFIVFRANYRRTAVAEIKAGDCVWYAGRACSVMEKKAPPYGMYRVAWATLDPGGQVVQWAYAVRHELVKLAVPEE